MISRFAVIAALFAAAVPATAQTPSRVMEAVDKICGAYMKDATPLADLAAATGALEVKSPLWPEYKNDGYPEKAFAWPDTPGAHVFVLTSQWTNVEPKCTLFLNGPSAKEAAGIVLRMMEMDKQLDGGMFVTVSDNGQLMMLTDNLKQFRGEMTTGKNKKFGDFVLVSLSKSMSYKPPAPPAPPATEPAPAAAPAAEAAPPASH